MLLLAPLRLLRLATIPSRIASHLLFRHRFGSVRAGLVLLAIAEVIAYFGRRRSNGPSA